ncbi:MAG TPA: methionine synthase [Thermoclostridium caenicola]|uniref:Vitamin B12 dependent methionine synthase, activation domain n=1 Tax=Thermoclostridium caenicola TaxID=659425 RepID=A0A1M6HCN1_9FIRM|nr:methionine synthase [Thermoclostridium caenicola]SHJ19916.1 hypothetical protein SAMN05444373_103122 [Thermoclostridium caenicola]HOK42227.1 methionine synthase [Thermoclostridium caenicola]HOL84972.1 methionine synthase [Thermoclostridium caenicola]HPO77314.1 methionine synthase [Thermoclostridium caenicola]
MDESRHRNLNGAMEDIKILRGIRPSYNKDYILARLGYKRGTTGLDENYRQMLDAAVQKAESMCSLALAYRMVGIEACTEDAVKLEDGTILSGKGLAMLLSESQQAVLMASTAGPRIMEEIRNLMDNGRASEAVILDAAASEIADAGLDFLMDYIGTLLRRQGKVLTRHRFSPGYGDVGLDQQAHLARLLDIGRLGVSLTETFILVPEKSVLAVAGVVEIKQVGKD